MKIIIVLLFSIVFARETPTDEPLSSDPSTANLEFKEFLEELRKEKVYNGMNGIIESAKKCLLSQEDLLNVECDPTARPPKILACKNDCKAAHEKVGNHLATLDKEGVTSMDTIRLRDRRDRGTVWQLRSLKLKLLSLMQQCGVACLAGRNRDGTFQTGSKPENQSNGQDTKQ